MNSLKHRILVVDDSKINRELLSDMLSDTYEVDEASDGDEALLMIQKNSASYSLMLLDFMMPKMNGIDVLDSMRKNGWLEEIPVIIISSETNAKIVETTYKYGASDFIFRPFNETVVQARVKNVIALYEKQHRLSEMVASQIYENMKHSNMLISVLSHIVEFRNGESGSHILNINTITGILLRKLMTDSESVKIKDEEINLICTASSLHDIGKIAIPDAILNKPGRYTPEEFAVMKTHSMEGANMLDKVPFAKDELLMKYAYEICRWHHERWDGKGYPDGLQGNDIPLSAQVVAIADVYDALTSERCYKKAFDHDTAINMIVNGECGAFNPKLLDCLKSVADTLKVEMKNSTFGSQVEQEFYNVAELMSTDSDHAVFANAFRKLRYEQNKTKFFADTSKNVLFEYIYASSHLTFSTAAKDLFGMPGNVPFPENDEPFLSIFPAGEFEKLKKALANLNEENPRMECVIPLFARGKLTNFKLVCQKDWQMLASGKKSAYAIIGKVMEEKTWMSRLFTH